MKKRLIEKIYNLLLEAEKYDYFEIRDLCKNILPSLSLKDLYKYYRVIKNKRAFI